MRAFGAVSGVEPETLSLWVTAQPDRFECGRRTCPAAPEKIFKDKGISDLLGFPPPEAGEIPENLGLRTVKPD